MHHSFLLSKGVKDIKVEDLMLHEKNGHSSVDEFEDETDSIMMGMTEVIEEKKST